MLFKLYEQGSIYQLLKSSRCCSES